MAGSLRQLREPLSLLLPERFREWFGPLPGAAEWYSSIDALAETSGDFDVIWAAGFLPAEVTRGLLQRLERLSWLHYSSTGVEHMPLELFKARDVVLTNGAGLYAPPIAEHVVMCMLAARRKLPDLLRAQATRTWAPEAEGDQELAGSKALIVGYGQLGQAIAHRLLALGVEVFAQRRTGPISDAEGVVNAHEWRDHLPEVDFLVLTLPSTAETRGIVGVSELAALKAGAWLVNVARGSLVDEAALLEALTSGHLGGAALDAFQTEPLPPDHPFWELENVILTPHSSHRSSRLAQRDFELFDDNLRRLVEHQELRNLVDLDAGY